MDKDLLGIYKKHFDNLCKEIKIQDVTQIHEDFLASYTYDAISLEGNSKMPYTEVYNIVKNDLYANKKDKYHKEVLNHIESFKYVLELLKNNTKLTEERLKDLHSILVEDIMIGGVYRNVNIRITDATHQPPDFLKVYDKMNQLFEEIETYDGSLLDKGIYLHASIAKIHPFMDGNGRLARLVLNYYLIKDSYVPITIPLDLRDEYFKNIEIFKVNKDIIPLTNFIKELLVERYLKLIDKLDK